MGKIRDALDRRQAIRDGVWQPLSYAKKAGGKKKKKKDEPNCKNSQECNVGGKRYCIPKGKTCGGKVRARLDPRRVDDLKKSGGTFEGAIGGLKNGKKYQVSPEMLAVANKMGVSQLQLQSGRVPTSVQTELRRRFNQMTIGDSVTKSEKTRDPAPSLKERRDAMTQLIVADYDAGKIDRGGVKDLISRSNNPDGGAALRDALKRIDESIAKKLPKEVDPRPLKISRQSEQEAKDFAEQIGKEYGVDASKIRNDLSELIESARQQRLPIGVISQLPMYRGDRVYAAQSYEGNFALDEKLGGLRLKFSPSEVGFERASLRDEIGDKNPTKEQQYRLKQLDDGYVLRPLTAEDRRDELLNITARVATTGLTLANKLDIEDTDPKKGLLAARIAGIVAEQINRGAKPLIEAEQRQKQKASDQVYDRLAKQLPKGDIDSVRQALAATDASANLVNFVAVELDNIRSLRDWKGSSNKNEADSVARERFQEEKVNDLLLDLTDTIKSTTSDPLDAVRAINAISLLAFPKTGAEVSPGQIALFSERLRRLRYNRHHRDIP